MEIKPERPWRVKPGDILELENDKFYLVVDTYCGWMKWALVDLNSSKLITNMRPTEVWGMNYFSALGKPIAIKYVYESEIELTHKNIKDFYPKLDIYQ